MTVARFAARNAEIFALALLGLMVFPGFAGQAAGSTVGTAQTVLIWVGFAVAIVVAADWEAVM